MCNFESIIETDRLLLRKITIDDADFVLSLFNDPTFIKNIGDKKVKTLEEATQHIIDNPLKSYEENGYGPYMVVIKPSYKAAGVCGFYKREQFKYPDIGYALFPQFTGKGYASEAAKAVLEYGLNTLKLKKVLGITSPNNERSSKLLEKIGLKLKEIIHYGKEMEKTKFYST